MSLGSGNYLAYRSPPLLIHTCGFSADNYINYSWLLPPLAFLSLCYPLYLTHLKIWYLFLQQWDILLCLVSLLFNILEMPSDQAELQDSPGLFSEDRRHTACCHYLKKLLYSSQFHFPSINVVFSCFRQKVSLSPMNFLFLFSAFWLVSYFKFSCQLHLKFVLLWY